MPELFDTPRRTITEWVRECYNAACEAGWWNGVKLDDPKEQAVKIALLHSELSEALEGIRKDIDDPHLPWHKNYEVELADVFIRWADFVGSLGFDIEAIIWEKMQYNKQRQDHRPEVRQAAGGKRF